MRANAILSVSSLMLSWALLSACGGSDGTVGIGDGNGNGPPPSGDDGGPTREGGAIPDPGLGSDAGHDTGGGKGDPETDGGQDAEAPVDAGPFVPAKHPPFPQLVNNGGPVLKNPVVQPIFFSNYDIAGDVATMLKGLPTATLAGGASYWTGAVAEYGVGALTMLPPITLSEAAPTTDTDPESFLQKKMSDPAFKGITSSTILAIFYPSTTPLGGSCAATTPGYGGYHSSFSNGGNEQPFAVMSECAPYGPTKTPIDMVAVAASHEIIEAVTDPYPSRTPGFTGLDKAGWALAIFLQGNTENGDVCTMNSGFGRGGASYPYLLQRGWSNKAAAAGNLDPCAPDIRPDQPFVGAYPVMPDTVHAVGQNGQGVIIPAGQTKTIDVGLFSFEPTPEFTVAARQASTVNPPTLSFTWDKTSGKNGDTLHLTIKAESVSKKGYESFVILASLPGVTDPQKTAWPGIVTH
jgi:hypothetical protein